MTTAADPATPPADVPNPSPKAKRAVTVTCGAAMLLEGIVQHQKIFPNQEKALKGCKLRRLLREQNPARTDTHDFEKGMVFPQTEEGVQKRIDWNDTFNAWKESDVVLSLTAKQFALAQEGLKAAFKQRDLGLLPENNEHVESLIENFLPEAVDDTDDTDEKAS